jgi:hypothetical protein
MRDQLDTVAGRDDHRLPDARAFCQLVQCFGNATGLDCDPFAYSHLGSAVVQSNQDKIRHLLPTFAVAAAVDALAPVEIAG